MATLLASGIAGCGSSATKTPTGSPSPHPSGVTPTSGGRTLFAVLETRHCQAPEPAACETPVSGRHDTAAIAGLDGFAVAKTTFAPGMVPEIGNAATILQLEGQVAAGGLYYIDGKGVVRRLGPGGSVQPVATFAVGAQQAVSFAVSPDGSRLIAAVLTFPNRQPSTNPNEPFGHFSGPYRLEIELASAGGTTSVVRKWESSTTQYPNGPGGFANIVVVGWDAQGPIALVSAATGTQNAWLDDQRWFQGSLARLHMDGTVGAAIGPANCLPYWRPVAGRFVCTKNPSGNQSGMQYSLVSLDGTVIANGVAPGSGPGQLAGGFAISPDGTRLAMDGQIVALPMGTVTELGANFTPEGWLDANTIIGLIPSPHTAGTLGVIRLSDPQHPENWGFSGRYVGTIESSTASPAI